MDGIRSAHPRACSSFGANAAGELLVARQAGSMECNCYSHMRCHIARLSIYILPRRPTAPSAPLDHRQSNTFASVFIVRSSLAPLPPRLSREAAAVHCDMCLSTSSPRTRHFFIPDTRAPCRYQHPAQLLPLVRIVAIPFKLDAPSRSSDVFILILFSRSWEST
ncbi:hypothetical protein C8R45DRAFT_597591 [Mycena sanguinolenta]|nr:hypothetical protein C8R45DRAFT_597591 [Mycena sanguinolenta]